MMTLQDAQAHLQDLRKPAQPAAAQVSLAPKGERTCAMSAQGLLPNRSKPAQLAANSQSVLRMRDNDVEQAERSNTRASPL